MKSSEIKVGKTYKNKGAGRSTRTVLEISKSVRPGFWFSTTSEAPDEPGVLFQNNKDGTKGSLYLRSFASWAGGMVEVDS